MCHLDCYTNVNTLHVVYIYSSSMAAEPGSVAWWCWNVLCSLQQYIDERQTTIHTKTFMAFQHYSVHSADFPAAAEAAAAAANSSSPFSLSLIRSLFHHHLFYLFYSVFHITRSSLSPSPLMSVSISASASLWLFLCPPLPPPLLSYNAWLRHCFFYYFIVASHHIASRCVCVCACVCFYYTYLHILYVYDIFFIPFHLRVFIVVGAISSQQGNAIKAAKLL